jgi:HSP20 family protein
MTHSLVYYWGTPVNNQNWVQENWVGDFPQSNDSTGWIYGDNHMTLYPTTTHIKKEFEDFFKVFEDLKLQGKPFITDDANLPKVNAYEDKDGLVIESTIPFAKKEQVQVTIDPVSRAVLIAVEKHQEKKEDKEREYHLKEISRSSFRRGFIIGAKFDLENADANFEDGVLTICVPYGENAKKKVLQIK